VASGALSTGCENPRDQMIIVAVVDLENLGGASDCKLKPKKGHNFVAIVVVSNQEYEVLSVLKS